MKRLLLMTVLIMLMSVFGVVGIESASAQQISIQALPDILSKIQSSLNALQSDVSKIRDQTLPTWSQKLQCDATACPRFELVLDGAAVLDKETGLVWEKSPGTIANTWGWATLYCTYKKVGGREGWRLPTVEELASLVDPSVASGPALPSGHHFTNVQSSKFWSATTSAEDADAPWLVDFRIGSESPTGSATLDSKSTSWYAWCVRGAGYDSR